MQHLQHLTKESPFTPEGPPTFISPKLPSLTGATASLESKSTSHFSTVTFRLVQGIETPELGVCTGGLQSFLKSKASYFLSSVAGLESQALSAKIRRIYAFSALFAQRARPRQASHPL